MDTIDSPKTALIVGDNDQAVLQSVSSLLGKIGFVVLRASGGSNALDCCSRRMQTVDLAVIDSTMSDMTAMEFAGRLEEIAPFVRVLFLWDWATIKNLSPTVAHGRLHQNLPKPFRRAAFLVRVLDMMDRPITRSA
jgi:two-component SAPR family response regulator